VVAAGHPEGYWEMRRLTELYKKALGLPYKEVPQTLIDLEAEIRKMKEDIEAETRRGESPEVVSQKHARLAQLEYRFRQLIISFEQAKG